MAISAEREIRAIAMDKNGCSPTPTRAGPPRRDDLHIDRDCQVNDVDAKRSASSFGS
jgi:hypothetical protein